MPTTVPFVKRTMPLGTRWRRYYDQGNTPRCVDFAASQERSLVNRRTYEAGWLYARCKERDGIPHLDGTYLRVAYDVLRDVGHVRRGEAAPDPAEGVAVYRWAASVDEVRAAIAAGTPVVAGTNWHRKMTFPEKRGGRWRMPEDADGSRLDGGHAYLLSGADDGVEAFLTPNSWGQADKDWHPHEPGYPVTLVPYRLFERLLATDGEAVLVTDR